jgi:hypothetical protein
VKISSNSGEAGNESPYQSVQGVTVAKEAIVHGLVAFSVLTSEVYVR